MPNNSLRINTLFQLYLSNIITHDEYQELLALLTPNTIGQSLHSELKELWAQSANQQVSLSDNVWYEKINFLIQKINTEAVSATPVKRLTNWYKLRWAAAVFLLIFSSGIFYLLKSPNSPATTNNSFTKIVIDKSVLPGGNKAVLILADCTSIILDSASNGTIANQGVTKVIKLNTGQLVYNSSGADPASVSYNTLTTPRGGQYQVTLQDGTVVWLNSGSSLRYPTAFIGNERKVYLTGEAYFEVAHLSTKGGQGKLPFIVKVNTPSGDGGEVEVLGTHFNINSYADEETINTTLLEGSVKVNGADKSILLSPGEQSRLKPGSSLQVVKGINIDEAVAWKEGFFHFESADLSTILRQFSRWYDIDIVYEGKPKQRKFFGIVSRTSTLMNVLKMLKANDINFRVEGKRLIVKSE